MISPPLPLGIPRCSVLSLLFFTVPSAFPLCFRFSSFATHARNVPFFFFPFNRVSLVAQSYRIFLPLSLKCMAVLLTLVSFSLICTRWICGVRSFSFIFRPFSLLQITRLSTFRFKFHRSLSHLSLLKIPWVVFSFSAESSFLVPFHFFSCSNLLVQQKVDVEIGDGTRFLSVYFSVLPRARNLFLIVIV